MVRISPCTLLNSHLMLIILLNRNVDSLPEDQVAAFYRGKHGDFALGSMASTNLTVIDGSPVMYLRDGSPCPGLSGSGEKGPAMLANTAIRFVCEPTTFGIGEYIAHYCTELLPTKSPLGTPKLIAQFPMDDEQSCSFYFEWRTHVRRPFYFIHKRSLPSVCLSLESKSSRRSASLHPLCRSVRIKCLTSYLYNR